MREDAKTGDACEERKVGDGYGERKTGDEYKVRTAYDDIEAVSFDLFGTLVTVDRPDDPAAAIATELESRGLSVPDDWERRYTASHITVPAGAELSLPRHVTAAVTGGEESIAAEATENAAESDLSRTVEDAVSAAFDRPVRVRPGAVETVETLAESYPVGVLSNCSVPTLAQRTLEQSALDTSLFETIVVSVDCGWRKPDSRAFESVATGLGVTVENLLHIGDDPKTDGGVESIGGTFISLEAKSMIEILAVIEGEQR